MRSGRARSVRSRRVGGLVVVLALGAAGCAGVLGDDSTTPATVPDPTPPPSSVPPTTTTTRPPPMQPPVFRPGDEGPEVAALQQRLVAMKYDLPAVDGVYDEATQHAVMAFQKVHGLLRDGFAGPETLETLAAVDGEPHPLVPDGEPDRVEVDLARQIVLLYRDGALVTIASASTGDGEVFCSEGSCRRAVTPVGDYRVGRRASGWETSPLGRLYNPLYFHGGIALHGALSVPASPASHGCVRVPMHTAEWLPDVVDRGMRVHVLEGRTDGGLDFQPPPPPPPAPEPPPPPAPEPPPPPAPEPPPMQAAV